MLRTLLHQADHDPQTAALARDGGRAYVALSLRPFLLAALIDREPDAGRRSSSPGTTAPRATSRPDSAPGWRRGAVRYYPSRGVTYQSHLAPPPHLVGQRIAALDALLDEPRAGERGRAGDRRQRRGAVGEGRRTRACARTASRSRVGELMDLDETAMDLVAAGYERVDQVEDRGQFAIRGGILDLYPATEDRAVRVELFGDEIESLRWFSTFTQRSLGDAEAVEIAPAAELAVEYRELAEIAALEKEEDRPDIAELLPVEDFRSFLELVPSDAGFLIAAEEEVRAGARRPLVGRDRGVPRHRRAPPVRRAGR